MSSCHKSFKPFVLLGIHAQSVRGTRCNSATFNSVGENLPEPKAGPPEGLLRSALPLHHATAQIGQLGSDQWFGRGSRRSGAGRDSGRNYRHGRAIHRCQALGGDPICSV